ncbi:YhdH/YhfP family quinone oxidoreductase [Parabacteroides sp. FAFU027]|uniref:YhdH/YhfP family quinone oxidoreductase n=1 Tax=Parabacteroides sp. FAFU027 TaxID=2922715 RepID=UPI001FAF6373|nr:YhdH/YhfP family quinone oxidoreductase [Parabacteroides sp. FAFU027]
MEIKFKALVVKEVDGVFVKAVENLTLADLPENEVLIKVSYSSINYKDALSASGNKGVTKKYPHIPGIDAVGKVVLSSVEDIKTDTLVLVTGYDLGMNTFGGFGEYISVPAAWVIPLPEAFTEREAMYFGTAGLTAGLSVSGLINNGITPEKGKIVVSGATGGVGSLSIAILKHLGYKVVAVSGKSNAKLLEDTLKVDEIITRDEFIAKCDSRPLSKSEFAAGIDTVGGNILSGMLKSVNYNGVVTCCGMIASSQLETSIFPFILRGVKLIGIDSVEIPKDEKKHIWNLLSTIWKPDQLEEITKEVSLEELPIILDQMLLGNIKGRYVLKHNF